MSAKYDRSTLNANLTWYRRIKDLVPLVDPKVHLSENSSLKSMAQLYFVSFPPSLDKENKTTILFSYFV